jgi:catechol 2,3-dioxygenase-like lactoylglutathione lyase family enzyme
MSAIPPRLTLVTLGARNFAQQRDFYKGLGWVPSIEVEDFVAFLLGGVILGIYPIENLTAEGAPGLKANGEWSGVTLAYNVERREDVDTMYASWVAAGAAPVVAPKDHPYGPRSGYVADPEGNRWEIAYADGMVFDEHGAVVRFGND